MVGDDAFGGASRGGRLAIAEAVGLVAGVVGGVFVADDGDVGGAVFAVFFADVAGEDGGVDGDEGAVGAPLVERAAEGEGVEEADERAPEGGEDKECEGGGSLGGCWLIHAHRRCHMETDRASNPGK